MCKYCEIDQDTGCSEDFLILADVDCGSLGKAVIDFCVSEDNGPIISMDLNRQELLNCPNVNIFFCPFCGRKLQQELRYRVSAEWIHPHKDSIGEYLDDLTYDQADAVRKQWQKDNIHKNVVFEKSELPFQGEGGNNGNKDTD